MPISLFLSPPLLRKYYPPLLHGVIFPMLFLLRSIPSKFSKFSPGCLLSLQRTLSPHKTELRLGIAELSSADTGKSERFKKYFLNYSCLVLLLILCEYQHLSGARRALCIARTAAPAEKRVQWESCWDFLPTPHPARSWGPLYNLPEGAGWGPVIERNQPKTQTMEDMEKQLNQSQGYLQHFQEPQLDFFRPALAVSRCLSSLPWCPRICAFHTPSLSIVSPSLVPTGSCKTYPL